MVNWAGVKEKAAEKPKVIMVTTPNDTDNMFYKVWEGAAQKAPAAEEKVLPMDEALEKYKDYIKRDYKRFADSTAKADDTDFQKKYREKTIKDFNDGLIHEVGKKYIKIVKSNNQASVHSFVVNVHNDKQFKYGDILKAASWAAPARNFARGNVFESDFATTAVSWCGA
jgi:hypothetical protein